MLKKYHKHFFWSAAIIFAIIAVRSYQAPVPTGAFSAPSAVSPAVPSIAANDSAAKLKIDFFDVGQGDSELITLPGGETILIDGGPDNKVVQKLGEYLPPARRYIDYIILTHPHADHVDGLPEVLRRYEVKEVIMTGVAHTTADYREFLQLVKDKGIPALAIERPQDLAIGGSVLHFLAPGKSLVGQRPENLNDSSIVFRLEYASTSALFTGDFEAEETLVAATGTILSSDVLKVGHHGSTNANSWDFLAAVKPKIAVIEVGADNSYGHPHYRTLYYLAKLGTQVFRTDKDGDIELVSDGRSFSRQ